MSNVMRIAMLLTAAFCLALPRAAAAEGHNSQGTLGSQGRDIRVVECPAGEVLKGFVGRKGAAIDQLQMLCAPLLWDGTTGATHPVGDAYGGFGGAPFPANACSPSSRIASAHVALTPANDMVAGIRLICVHQDGSVDGNAWFYGNSPNANGMFYDRVNNPLSSARNGATADYTCPDESFIGMRVRFDTAVRGLGMLCDTRAPPPQPVKAIKSTGRAKTTSAAASPSGSGLAPRVSIAGMWDFVADGRDPLRVQVVTQGNGLGINGADMMPIPVNGIMSGADAAQAGGFSGLLQPDRQMIVNYTQKNGDNGTCQLFYSADAKTIAGTCVDQAKATYQWRGERATGPGPTPRLDRGALHSVAVKKTVDVYDAPGGNGSRVGELAAGTAGVELVQACQDNWCHVRWPGHEGWVYSGPDYNSLDQ